MKKPTLEYMDLDKSDQQQEKEDAVVLTEAQQKLIDASKEFEEKKSSNSFFGGPSREYLENALKEAITTVKEESE